MSETKTDAKDTNTFTIEPRNWPDPRPPRPMFSDKVDKIFPALVKAQAEFHAVGKGGKNDYDNYNYATLEDYIKASSQAMANHGLALITTVPKVERLEDRTTSTGKTEYVAQVEITVRLIHDSGQWIAATCWGEGQDRADKCIYKAITGARKYGISCLLGLATTDDPEGDATVGGVNDKPASKGRRETKPKDTPKPADAPPDPRAEFAQTLRSWTGFADKADLGAAGKSFATKLGIEMTATGRIPKSEYEPLTKAIASLDANGQSFEAFMATEGPPSLEKLIGGK
jgi:hypothetical protein